ncbi:uncharacterized protein L201_003871 [Kwoniella dendrophila CBS 6074]|uniref:C2H2-type domain-containing protein n=1 Tax=Kwoniella dendrophila CBS 6074 TaxID=1295534 RepID=A0AAX4JUU0_9TREE
MNPGSSSSFFCTYEGCSKSFTRKDHLYRHAANHSSETFNCPKCNRPFKRVDLLQRHEKRNICGDEPLSSSNANKRRRTSESNYSKSLEKDEEGDENDIDGNDRQPVSAIPNPTTTSNQSISTPATSSLLVSTRLDTDRSPRNSGQTIAHQGNIEKSNDINNGNPPLNTSPAFLHLNNQHQQQQQQPTADIGVSTVLSTGGGYISNDTHGITNIASGITGVVGGNGDFMSISDLGFGLWAPEQWEALLHESLAPPFNEPIIPNSNFDHNYNSQSQLNYQFQPQPQTPSTSSSTMQNHFFNQQVSPVNPISQQDQYQQTLPPLLHHPNSQSNSHSKYQLQSDERGQSANNILFQSPTDSMAQNDIISEGLLRRLQMSFPEFDVSLSFVNECLLNYWNKTAPTFPFIHRPTFDVDSTSSELLIMMIIIGSVNSHSTSDFNFSNLVIKIRGLLVQECGLNMKITTLQAFTLCHVYDTWFGNSESLFVAQCMWPVMVAHSRKKGIGVQGKTNDSSLSSDSDDHKEESWIIWAKEEERRRSAYCVLLIDTQLSAFWNQHCSRQLSIFAHNLNLPCSNLEWEAKNAIEWLKVKQSQQNSKSNNDNNNSNSNINKSTTTTKPNKTTNSNSKSGYLPGLHPEFTVTVVAEGYSSAIMSALSEEHKFLFQVDLNNSLTCQMVLIGLIAIAWDCRTRGGMGIRFREGTKHWRSIVFNAVIQLRAAYESAVMHMSASIESRDMRDTFAICIISVLSDIPMLHVAAGATTFCGASIGPRQYSDAKRRLKLWAKTDDAWTCVWQSVRYLRQALFSEWGLYSTWAVFNTTLVLWGYTTTILHVNPSTSTSNEMTVPLAHPNTEYPSSLTDTTSPLVNEGDKQRKITNWLDGILNTQGKLDYSNENQHNNNIDEIMNDLLKIVSSKLNQNQKEIDRDNSGLLSKLKNQKRGNAK